MHARDIQVKAQMAASKQSIVTNPRDDHVDFDSFFDENAVVTKGMLGNVPNATIVAVLSDIVDFYQYRVDASFGSVPESCAITGHSGHDDSSVKVILDGMKLRD